MRRPITWMTWLALLALVIALSACNLSNVTISGTTSGTTDNSPEKCPRELQGSGCLTPRDLRQAYGVESLYQQGYTGKGQTVIDIVSYGSPTLQDDMDQFDRQFGLPPITLQVLAPLGTVPFKSSDHEMQGWAGETTLDVQIIHAIAPDAKIIVMTSPVDETEGTIGLPQFMQLEQYAVAHKLGCIFSQSWTASEATLTDSAGQALVQQYADWYKQIITQQGCIVVNASGDSGATDYADLQATQLNTARTVGFPADVPWVTTVGGTSLVQQGGGYNEVAWNGSGGGTSKFFAEPDFQQALPASDQAILGGQRGLPDVAADADPSTGMAFYVDGGWDLAGGTSAAAPVWAGIFAIADQMAGHALGNVNPALYQLGASHGGTDFRDITQGDNNVDESGVQVPGFDATSGWDAVTGWGAPQADKLLPDLIAALK